MELSEGKEITALRIVNHSYGNSQDPIMTLGTSDKKKLQNDEYKCTRTTQAAAANSVYCAA